MPHLAVLLFQIAVIAITARVVGLLFRKIGQPQVVGEMAAGVMLGPSLLGWALPEASQMLFPAASLDHLNILSQIGLLLFMFLVGLEFDSRMVRNQGHAAILTSHVSITLPYMLGAALALYLYPRLSDERVQFTEFALFMGAAMSITAFPVLARILRERQLHKTELGSVTIACAAVDDVTAWCLLAYILVLVRAAHGAVPLWVTLAGLTVYLLFMVFVVKKLLTRFVTVFRRRKVLSEDMMAVILVLLLISAWATERLGVHLLFGAFLFGAVMPKEKHFIAQLTEKIESVTLVLFLPIFFAYTGLRTSVGLVTGGEMWFYCVLILLAAVVGKLAGSAIASRVAGLGWRDSIALGVLMNTRGLMELVILNIGLDLGVISPALFSMMVIMALATTFMTTPMLELIYPAKAIRAEQSAAVRKNYAYTETW
jgi:Kef-type K+ transport system membrane component KefB